MGDYGIESTLTDQAPKTGIVEPEERFLAGATIGDMRPSVPVEKRNIPLECGAKFGVVGSFGSPQIAIGNVNFNFGADSEAPKNWRAVLNRVGSHKEDLKASLKHKGTFSTKKTILLFSLTVCTGPSTSNQYLGGLYGLLVGASQFVISPPESYL
jgi:hypothetical protein